MFGALPTPPMEKLKINARTTRTTSIAMEMSNLVRKVRVYAHHGYGWQALSSESLTADVVCSRIIPGGEWRGRVVGAEAESDPKMAAM